MKENTELLRQQIRKEIIIQRFEHLLGRPLNKRRKKLGLEQVIFEPKKQKHEQA